MDLADLEAFSWYVPLLSLFYSRSVHLQRDNYHEISLKYCWQDIE